MRYHDVVMDDTAPSPNGDNGRDASGRFVAGNPGGPGNPHARQVGQLRSALIEAVTDKDIERIFATLVRRAIEGDVRAAKEVLDRVLGRPQEAVVQLHAHVDEVQFSPRAQERLDRMARMIKSIRDAEARDKETPPPL